MKRKPLSIVAVAAALICAGCAVFAVTSKTDQTDSEDGLEHSAVDYCHELTQPLANLMGNLYRSDVDETRWNMIEVRTIARRAESDGVEIYHPANQWILELNRSSDLAIYLLNNGQAEFTDEEFVDYVGRIAFWFEHGLAVCGGQQV
ncbi:hypothetical protein N9D44_01790 [Pontimonas sp.]|nr:hypothetical protein [Pontimonas sp.]